MMSPGFTSSHVASQPISELPGAVQGKQAHTAWREPGFPDACFFFFLKSFGVKVSRLKLFVFEREAGEV